MLNVVCHRNNQISLSNLTLIRSLTSIILSLLSSTDSFVLLLFLDKCLKLLTQDQAEQELITWD